MSCNSTLLLLLLLLLLLHQNICSHRIKHQRMHVVMQASATGRKRGSGVFQHRKCHIKRLMKTHNGIVKYRFCASQSTRSSTNLMQASTSSRERGSGVAQQRKRRHIERMIESGLSTAFPSDTFPFAVRMHVDLLASDGSEAMLALSTALLAMADAGVPLRDHVAGIAFGPF